jgi:hypothetical protein
VSKIRLMLHTIITCIGHRRMNCELNTKVSLLQVHIRFNNQSPSQQIIKVYRDGRFYWWGKPEYPEKTVEMSQVTDKFYHIMLY